MSRCRFVEDHQADYPVNRLCVLAGVSRSGFYAWRCRTPSKRTLANERLFEEIREIHERSPGTYGRVKILGQLERRGLPAVHKRVARLMRLNGIRGVGGPGSKASRRAGRHTAPAPDLIRRDFTAQASGQRWVADITEFPTLEGKLHLAGIVDLYSNRVVGWAMPDRRTAELCVDALVMAIRRRRPPRGMIHHADHGSQGSTPRFCSATAPFEAFWSTLKRELRFLHGRRVWTDRASLRAAPFDYIEIFYNRDRHQARLAYRTPVEYEQRKLRSRSEPQNPVSIKRGQLPLRFGATLGACEWGSQSQRLRSASPPGRGRCRRRTCTGPSSRR